MSADQWWASQSDARIEESYLGGMLDDITATQNVLDDRLGKAQRYLEASGKISTLPRRDGAVPPDSLNRLIGDALFNLVSWDSRLSTLDDLKNTGRLGLISDVSIRRGLAEIDRLTSAILNAEDDLLETQHQIIDPFMIRRTDLPGLIPTAVPGVASLLGPPPRHDPRRSTRGFRVSEHHRASHRPP